MKKETTQQTYVEPEGFKGSPGKWFVIDGWDEKGEGKYFPSVILDKEENEKSNYDGGGGIVVNQSYNQEAESIMANAHIIASAKELAKALQEDKRWINIAISDLEYLLSELKKHGATGSFRATTTIERLKEATDNSQQVLKDAGL